MNALRAFRLLVMISIINLPIVLFYIDLWGGHHLLWGENHLLCEWIHAFMINDSPYYLHWCDAKLRCNAYCIVCQESATIDD